jgi:two-component system, OmpR family, sensor histidine kinase VicK
MECHLIQPEQAIWVMTDAHRMSQALTNILSNAVRYSPESSAIRMVLDNARSWARIRIEDDGPGIPSDLRAQLFERFSMAGKSGPTPGTGLGLYISRQILSELGGTIELDDEYERGAAFDILLPVSPNMEG